MEFGKIWLTTPCSDCGPTTLGLMVTGAPTRTSPICVSGTTTLTRSGPPTCSTATGGVPCDPALLCCDGKSWKPGVTLTVPPLKLPPDTPAPDTTSPIAP